MDVTIDQFSDWLTRYFTAWQSNNPADVSPLFAEDAIYHYGPFTEPARGRNEIVANWIDNPEQQLDVSYEFEVLATGQDLGFGHWKVSFRTQRQPEVIIELDGILVIRFNEAMECTQHQEWCSRREIGPHR